MRKLLQYILPVLVVVLLAGGLFVGCKKQSDVTPPKDTQKEVLTEDEQKAKIYSFSTYGEGYKIVRVRKRKLDANLVVPSTYCGKPVVALEEELFYSHDEIESVVIPDSVTSMGREIFSNCNGIKSVKLSNNLTVIPDEAFYYCPSLVSVDMGNGVIQINSNAFDGCGNLETIKMSQNLESIGEGAFSYCRSLGSIVIPNGVTTIGGWAFENCTSLVEVWNLSDLQIEVGTYDYGQVAQYALAVYTDASVESKVSKDANGFLTYTDAEKGEYVLVGYEGTEKNITLPENVSGYNYKIRDYAFWSNQDIVSVILSDGVESIGRSAFCDCDALETVVLGNGVTRIFYGAFDSCNKLKSVVIPDSVQAIGEWAFAYCYNLSSVVIGRGVQEIGDGSFNECHKLVEVWNLSELEIEDEDSLGGVSRNALGVYTDLSVQSKVSKDANGFVTFADTEEGVYALLGYEGTTADVELVLPANILGNNYSIHDYAFYEKDNITSVSIPEAVTRIGRYAFYNCYRMNTANIPNSVTYIGDDAFYCCQLQCTTLYIGSEIEFIGSYAFWNNNALDIFVFDENINWTNLTITSSLSWEEIVVVVKGTDKKTIETALKKLAQVSAEYCSGTTIQIDASLVDLIPNTYGFAGIEAIQ